MTWGWIVAGFGIQCVALGMAEICSRYVLAFYGSELF